MQNKLILDELSTRLTKLERKLAGRIQDLMSIQSDVLEIHERVTTTIAGQNVPQLHTNTISYSPKAVSFGNGRIVEIDRPLADDEC